MGRAELGAADGSQGDAREDRQVVIGLVSLHVPEREAIQRLQEFEAVLLEEKPSPSLLGTSRQVSWRVVWEVNGGR